MFLFIQCSLKLSNLLDPLYKCKLPTSETHPGWLLSVQELELCDFQRPDQASGYPEGSKSPPTLPSLLL